MTRNRGFKRLIRERTKRTSESYSTARAHLRRRGEQADAQLVTRSAAPIVRRLRAADPIARKAVVPGLTREQGALLAFWILYIHTADGLLGLCRTHPHRLVDPDFWTLMQTGLRDQAALVAMLARLRAAVERAVATTPERSDYAWLESLDADELRQLDAEFQTIMPSSLHRMANHIRAHRDHFPTGEVAA